MTMRVQTFTDGDPLTQHHNDATARALLESAAQHLLAAETELRIATTRWEAVVAACRRHRQDDLVTEALKNLQDRRPA
jgi:hypothetical protein